MCLVAITWGMNKIKRKKQYLIFFFVCISSFFSLSLVIIALGNRFNKSNNKSNNNNNNNNDKNVNSNLCHDNATERNQSDGISLCIISAAIIMYCGLSLSICWCVQGIELFTKIILKRKEKLNIFLSIFFIFILPIIPVLYSAIYGHFGYGRVLPFCFITYKNTYSSNFSINYEFQVFYLPVLIIILIGSACMLSVICKIASGSFFNHNHLRNIRVAPDFVQGKLHCHNYCYHHYYNYFYYHYYHYCHYCNYHFYLNRFFYLFLFLILSYLTSSPSILPCISSWLPSFLPSFHHPSLSSTASLFYLLPYFPSFFLPSFLSFFTAIYFVSDRLFFLIVLCCVLFFRVSFLSSFSIYLFFLLSFSTLFSLFFLFFLNQFYQEI